MDRLFFSPIARLCCSVPWNLETRLGHLLFFTLSFLIVVVFIVAVPCFVRHFETTLN